MAINVNTVYTTVLSILNKEQRGYLTPDEFNKLGTQVQLEIFEKFFEDYNQYLRMPKTDEEFASRVDHIREEFQVFEKTESASAHASNVYTQPVDLHRFGSATYTKANGQPPIEITSSREYRQQSLSPLLQPSLNFPIAKYKQDKLTVFPSLSTFSNSDVSFNYIRKPKDVRWGYTVGNLGQYIYDPTSFDNTSLIVNQNITNRFDPNSSNPFNNAVLVNNTGGTFNLTQSVAVGPGTFQPQTGVTGTGAEIQIVVSPSGGTNIALSSANTAAFVTNVGSGYKVGDQFLLSSQSIGTTNPLMIELAASNLMSASGQGSLQFEISESQQIEVILGILKYAGIIIKDTQIIQAASGLQQLDEQNSKK
jgi:hypothetical protein